jgi:endonuclease YncB( thermonuclease family)
LLLVLLSATASADVAGIPTITDGDTLRFGDTRVRLFGIDAPESKQTYKRGGVDWLCGQEAGKALRELVAGQSLTCDERDKDRYGRIVAVCVLPDGRDIGAIMVSEGLALDYIQYSKGMYSAQEAEAREAKRGMWAGEFVKPWGWRQGK